MQREYSVSIRNRDSIKVNLASLNLWRVIYKILTAHLSLVDIYGRKWQNLQDKKNVLKNLTSEFKITH